MQNFNYLLDTNILSDLLKNPNGIAAKRINQIEQNTLCTTIIVACELRYGAEKKGSALLSSRVDALLDNIEVLPLSDGVDRKYACVRNQLETQGTPIGPNDLLIASHALSFDLTVVTANVKEFSRVTGLRVENWLVQTLLPRF